MSVHPGCVLTLEAMGYKNIVEMDHGKTFELAPDFKITSYQFSSPFGDSAYVIESEGVTLFNANDTKFRGLAAATDTEASWTDRLRLPQSQFGQRPRSVSITRT